MNSRGKRMVQEDELAYLQELKEAHSDPSAEWGGGGSSLEAGAGIDITEGVLSVDYGAGLTVDDGTLVVDASTVAMKSELATVATTGNYSDLTGTPSIPAAQVNSDWNATSGVAEILNKPSLATVATTGSYSDLSGTPTIPAAVSGTNDGTNWTSLTVGSDTYNIPAGGSGSSYTFTDGLTETSGTVSWDLNDNIVKKGSGIVIGNSTWKSKASVVQGEGSLSVGNSNSSNTNINNNIGSITFGCAASNRCGFNAGQGAIAGGYIEGRATSGRTTIYAGKGSISVGGTSGEGQLGDNSYEYTQSFGFNNTPSANYQMVIGKYNDSTNTSDMAFVIGNGTTHTARSNAMTVSTDGTIVSKNLPAVDTTIDGTYVLEATVLSGVVTYAWVLKA